MLYGAEYWTVKNLHIQKMKKIRNADILDKVGVGPMVDKMGEVRLRWFGYVKRRCSNAPVRKCER